MAVRLPLITAPKAGTSAPLVVFGRRSSVDDEAEGDRRRLDDHLPGIGEGVEVGHGREVIQQIGAAALAVTHRVIGEEGVGQVDFV